MSGVRKNGMLIMSKVIDHICLSALDLCSFFSNNKKDRQIYYHEIQTDDFRNSIFVFLLANSDDSSSNPEKLIVELICMLFSCGSAICCRILKYRRNEQHRERIQQSIHYLNYIRAICNTYQQK
jgi:hypothetical protein